MRIFILNRAIWPLFLLNVFTALKGADIIFYLLQWLFRFISFFAVISVVLTGVVLSNLHAVDLSSSRNLAIIGTSIFTGLMVPHWIEEYPTELSTGKVAHVSHVARKPGFGVSDQVRIKTGFTVTEDG